MIVIGIDPGVKTGFAVANDGRLVECEGLMIHEAMERVLLLHRSVKGAFLVRFEDARKRTWFGDKGNEAKQGAGSIKRDCKIWADFLASHGIAYEAVAPKAGNTKWSAEWLKKAYGWDKKTNEHGRDAAVLAM